MKIAILTHPLRTNYGGILQNYALQKYLTKLFFVIPPTAKVIQAIADGLLDEFEVVLTQIGGEATS